MTGQQDLLDRLRPGRLEGTEQFGEVVAAVGHVPARVVPHVDRGVAELCLQAVTVGRGIAGPPPPGVIRLPQAVHEHRQPGRGVREHGGDLAGGQSDIVPARAHRHPDGQRFQAGSEPVTGHGVQRGEGQVARLRPARPAAPSSDAACPAAVPATAPAVLTAR